MNIIEKIDRILRPTLNESAHVDLAVKLLKEHGLVPEGVDPRKIAKGIAKHHGVPGILVPQIIHRAAAVRDAGIAELSANTGNPPQRMGAYRGHKTWADAIEQHKLDWVRRLRGYADGSHVHADVQSSRDPMALIEDATDRTRTWHELATHPAKHRILDDAVISRSLHYDHIDEESRDDDVRDAAEAHVDSVAHHGTTNIHYRDWSRYREAYDHVHDALADYNPFDRNTWEPHKSQHATHTDLFWRENARTVGKLLAERKGLTIPYTPDHEFHHEKNGVTYRGYKLDTPEKANADCWGRRFCIATGHNASSMNEHYHGGTYKTAHIITKVSKLPEGGTRETVHAAYLPELLHGEEHEKPDQAVRNSGNSGAVGGKAFDAIHPLLSKLDSRIDGVSHHYRNGNV